MILNRKGCYPLQPLSNCPDSKHLTLWILEQVLITVLYSQVSWTEMVINRCIPLCKRTAGFKKKNKKQNPKTCIALICSGCQWNFVTSWKNIDNLCKFQKTWHCHVHFKTDINMNLLCPAHVLPTLLGPDGQWHDKNGHVTNVEVCCCKEIWTLSAARLTRRYKMQIMLWD